MKLTMPVVKNSRFILRDIEASDYLDYFDVGKDAITTKYLSWGPFKRPQEALWVIENINFRRTLDGLPVGYAIVDPKTKKMIGTVDFHTYYSYQNAAEIGFCLHKDYWNKGLITRILREMIILGFEHLELSKIIIGHVKENIASERVILKNGFKYERTVYNGFTDKEDNTLHDIVYYSIYQYEYQRGSLIWQ